MHEDTEAVRNQAGGLLLVARYYAIMTADETQAAWSGHLAPIHRRFRLSGLGVQSSLSVH
jgi:hypothetical protein